MEIKISPFNLLRSCTYIFINLHIYILVPTWILSQMQCHTLLKTKLLTFINHLVKIP